MRISESDIQNTVLEVFARRGLVAGDMMWLSRLESFWAETHLRRADLLQGVTQLCAQGALEIEELDGQTCLSLTEAGQTLVAAMVSAGEGYWGRYLQKELLPAVRLLSPAEGHEGSGRRDYEADDSGGIPWSRR